MADSRYSRITGAERYHVFDNLRGIMLMLLIVLHASAAYMVTPLDTIWPLKDSSTHLAFDILGAFIHTFRLPLFFIMAGFFGAMLYHQRGTGPFLKNRVQRIGIPLIVFWVLLAPLILAPFALNQLDSDSRSLRGLLSWLISADALTHLHFFHLWFLFDLLIYYGAILLLIRLSDFTGLTLGERGHRTIGWLFRSSWGPLVFAAATAMTLLPMKLGMLETPATFARPLFTLLADAVFVLFGWGFYIRRDLVSRFAPPAWIYTLLGIAFFVAHLVCVALLLDGYSGFHLPSVILSSLSIWLLVYGIIGLFVRYCGQSSRIMRYISDSSYWCYLVHLPLVAWLTVMLSGWPAPAILKYTIVLLTTVLVCLLTYDLFVRSTLIGVLINGRRRPRLIFTARIE